MLPVIDCSAWRVRVDLVVASCTYLTQHHHPSVFALLSEVLVKRVVSRVVSRVEMVREWMRVSIGRTERMEKGRVAGL